MGGPGSGRWKGRVRKTVESCLMLDVNQLAEKGCLQPGCASTCQWIVKNEAASINVRAVRKAQTNIFKRLLAKDDLECLE